VSPLRGEKPQNRPLSKLNTGRFALRAMLPVTIYRLSVSLFRFRILPALVSNTASTLINTSPFLIKFHLSVNLAIVILVFAVSAVTLIPQQPVTLPPPSFTPNSVTIIAIIL